MADRRDLRGISFDPNPAWDERMIVAYTAPMKSNAHTANLVVTREPLREGETLKKHADRLLRDAAAQFDGFELLERGESVLGGMPALSYRFVIGTPIAVLEQNLFLVELVCDGRRFAAMINTTVPRDQAAAMRPVFDEMLKSVRFDGKN